MNKKIIILLVVFLSGCEVVTGGAVLKLAERAVDSCALAAATLEKNGYVNSAPGTWNKENKNDGETVLLVCGGEPYELSRKLEEKREQWIAAHPKMEITAQGDAAKDEVFLGGVMKLFGGEGMITEKIFYRIRTNK